MMWVSKKNMQRLEENVKALNQALDKAADTTMLVDIVTKGKKVKFIFTRNKEIFEVETMRLMSNNINQWKEDLLR